MAEENAQQTIEALQKAYWKEIESIINYQANAINLDGLRAREISEILTEEVNDELNHSKKLAERIKELGGKVPGSSDFKAEQNSNQPSDDTTDIESVVNGVIDAEVDAINHYQYIIDITDGKDYVTNDLVISLKADEEHHLRIFKGFKKALEKEQSVV